MVTGRKYRVVSQEEYTALKERVTNGAKFLEGKWFDPKYKREQAHYNEMAMALYNWDLDHGIIERGIEEMIRKEKQNVQSVPKANAGTTRQNTTNRAY